MTHMLQVVHLTPTTPINLSLAQEVQFQYAACTSKEHFLL